MIAAALRAAGRNAGLLPRERVLESTPCGPIAPAPSRADAGRGTARSPPGRIARAA